MAIAIFFVAIMIGATFFAAFHHLPEDEETGEKSPLVWDMNIYKHRGDKRKYRGTGLSLSLDFPDELRHSDIRIHNDDVSLTYEIQDMLKGKNNGEAIRNSKGLVDGNRIVYPDVFEGVDLEFRVAVNGLKEFLILEEPPRYMSGDLVIRSQFSYPPSSLEPAIEGTRPTGGQIDTDEYLVFVDRRSEEVLRLSPPIAFDSPEVIIREGDDGDRSTTVPVESPRYSKRNTVNGTHTIKENLRGAEYTMTIPWEFLSDPTTSYPVYIDPDITSQITDDVWYSEETINAMSNVDIASGGSLNIHECKLLMWNDQNQDAFDIIVASGAALNIYSSKVYPNSAGDTYDFTSSGDLVIQDYYDLPEDPPDPDYPYSIKDTANGVTVTGGTVSVRGAILKDSGGIGLSIASADAATIFDTAIQDSTGIGLKVSSSEFELLQSTITSNGGIGTEIFSCTGQISETTISSNTGDGLKIHGTTENPSEVDVVECTIDNNQGIGVRYSHSSGLVYGSDIYSNNHGIKVDSSSDPMIVENDVHENSNDGIIVSGASPSLSENNVHDHASGAGLYIEGSSNPITSYDVLDSNQIGVYVKSNSGGQVSNIEVVQSTSYGMKIEDSTFSVVDSNIESSSTKDVLIAGGTGPSELSTVNTYFNKGLTQIQANPHPTEESRLFVKWYLDLQILSDSGLPWANEDVKITDKANNIIQTSTGADGRIPTEVISEYKQELSSYTLYQPITITMGGVDSNVYMSSSRDLTIYNNGDTDGDNVFDNLEDNEGHLWFEAEGHGFGSSHIVEDPFALNHYALTTWEDTVDIVNEDTFFSTNVDTSTADMSFKFGFRARAIDDGRSIHVAVHDGNGPITTWMSDYYLDTDYYWFFTEWITPNSPPLVTLSISEVGTPSGAVRIDRICFIPKEYGNNRQAFEGQISDPTEADTDGDLMPDGGEHRTGSIWIEGEHVDPAGNLIQGASYSGSYSLRMNGGQLLNLVLNPYLAGPLQNGHYVVKARMKTLGNPSTVTLTWTGVNPNNAVIQVSATEMEWHTIPGLIVINSDVAGTLQFQGNMGDTYEIDKVGVLLIVDDPPSNVQPSWKWSNNLQANAVLGDYTPAVYQKNVFVTSTNVNPHFAVYDPGGAIVSPQPPPHQNFQVNSVTSPTVTDVGVTYAYQDAAGSTLRMVDKNGVDVWPPQQGGFGTPYGQVQQGENVIVSGSGAVECYNVYGGSQVWTKATPIGGAFPVPETPIVYGDYILLLGVDNPYSPTQAFLIIIDSDGVLRWVVQITALPKGIPAVENGIIFLSFSNSIEAWSFDIKQGPQFLWTTPAPANHVVATEPICSGDEVIILLTDNGGGYRVACYEEKFGANQWIVPNLANAAFSGSVASRSPVVVDGRIYFLSTDAGVGGTNYFLDCVDLYSTVNAAANPLVLHHDTGIAYTGLGPAFLDSTPVLSDLDGNGYLDVVFNTENGLSCFQGGGVWYQGVSAWGQFRKDAQRMGTGSYELPYFTLAPTDIDMDHDGMNDGSEVIAYVKTERAEFEDVHDFNVWSMGDTLPAQSQKIWASFFHQTGVALRTTEEDGRGTFPDFVLNGYDDPRVDSDKEDSWIEIKFQVPVSGQYKLQVTTDNGLEDKESRLYYSSGGGGGSVRGTGYSQGIYIHTGDGYAEDSIPQTGAADDALFGHIWEEDADFLKAVIEAATYFEMTVFDGNTEGYIPYDIPDGDFKAIPTGIRQPVFDRSQLYVQGVYEADLHTYLCADTDYYFRVGLDLDRVPMDLFEFQQTFPGEITRIDILDVDFALAMVRGCEPFDPDPDGDTMEDGDEYELGFFNYNADADEDGLSDPQEYSLLTDPGNRDSDFDGLRDRIELGRTVGDDDPHTPWDGDWTTASLWERTLRYCGGNPIDLGSGTPGQMPNGVPTASAGTDPNDPDTDGDGIPDGCIDGWWYDPVGYSQGQYTTTAVSLNQYKDAFSKPYDEDYWGFVGTSDNYVQVWEGEDFNLDGVYDTGTWSFEEGSGIDPIGVRTGDSETDPTDPDSDDDDIDDGYEILFSQEPPYRTQAGFYAFNPRFAGDAGWDVDSKVEQCDVLGDSSDGFETLDEEGTYSAYAMKYVPVQDAEKYVTGVEYIRDVAVEIEPSFTDVKGEFASLEIFQCGNKDGFSDLDNKERSTFSSSDGGDGMYLFPDVCIELSAGTTYYFILRARSGSFVVPTDSSGAGGYKYSTALSQWVPTGDSYHMKLYRVASDADGLTNLEEFAAGTNPKSSDSDAVRLSNRDYTDTLTDGEECKWVLRSNAENGAYQYSGYKTAGFLEYDGDADGGTWSAKQYIRQLTYTDPTDAEVPDGDDLVTIATLKDGTVMLLEQDDVNPWSIYVWKPGSSPFEVTEVEGGSDYYKGECVWFKANTVTVNTDGYLPTVTYRNKLLFLADPLDIDTDNDGILDGNEIRWDEDCSYAEAEGTSADTLNNARDLDSDNDGIKDNQEPFWDQDLDCPTDIMYSFDSDTYKGMVDADSDGDGMKDGDEIDARGDTDGDGYKNIHDIDSDGDGLADGWIDQYEWDWGQGKFIYPGSGTVDVFDATEGEAGEDGIFKKEEDEPSPVLFDTDNDGLWDGTGDGTGSEPWGELEVHSHHGHTAADNTSQVDPDTDDDGLIDSVEVIGWSDKIKKRTSETLYDFSWVPVTIWSDPTLTDTDSDGLDDALEYQFSDPFESDTDDDGWTDNQEDDNQNGVVDAGETDPRNADSDGDRLLDGYKFLDGVWVGEDYDRDGDYDVDIDSNPLNPDTDGDLVLDGPEYGLSKDRLSDGYADTDGDGKKNILDKDSDNDGLTDWEENYENPWTCPEYDEQVPSSLTWPETDPFDKDTDGDGLYDYAEPSRSIDLPASVENEDTYPNARDGDSNGDNSNGDGTPDDDDKTYVVFRTNAPLASEGIWVHDYESTDVWIALDKYCDLDGSTGDYVFSLTWSTHTGYKYTSPPLTSKPDGIDDDDLIMIYKGGNSPPNNGIRILTPEGYELYDYGTDSGNERVLMHNHHTDEWYVFVHTGSAPTGYEDSKKSNSGFIRYRQETYDWRYAITADTDGDGVNNNLDPDPADADTDDDGVPDGMEIDGMNDMACDHDTDPNWDDPDSDGDGISDGTEMGYTKPVLNKVNYKGTNTATKYDASQSRLTWTPDADPTTVTNPIDPDTDGDGLYDGWRDWDDDGLFDSGEVAGESVIDRTPGVEDIKNYDGKLETTECDPNDADSDDDGLFDGWIDTDQDLIWDTGEVKGDVKLGIDPLKFDTDGDGLSDGLEMGVTECSDDTDPTVFIPDGDPSSTTNPNLKDTDQDGFDDDFEDVDKDGVVDFLETNPVLKDTDGDGLSDSTEDADSDHVVDTDQDNNWIETDPLVPDTDADGLYDGWDDVDRDGVKDTDEADGETQYGTDPKLSDTDEDGLSDGTEIIGWQVSIYYEATGEKVAGYPIVVDSNPLLSNSDSDDLSDSEEYENATDPKNPDSDGDGISDSLEVNGETPSDPLGIEGAPPTIKNMNVRNIKIKKEVLGIKITVGYKMEISVDVSDNVGLDWVQFHVKGIDKKKRYLSGESSEPVAMTFDTDWKKSLFSGYDVNITAADVNKNIGYMEEHIPSILELFLKALLDALKALAEFIMELASAAINWIWNAIESMVQGFIDPIKDATISYADGILESWSDGKEEYEINNEISSETKDEIEDALFSPFLFKVLGIFIVITIIMAIIKFFCPIMSWLLLAVLVVIFTVMLAYIGSSVEEDDVDEGGVDKSLSGIDPFNYISSQFINDYGEETREEITFIDFIFYIVEFTVSVYTLYKAWGPAEKVGKTGRLIGLFALSLVMSFIALMAPMIWTGDDDAQYGVWWICLIFGVCSFIPAIIAWMLDLSDTLKLITVIVGAVGLILHFGIVVAESIARGPPQGSPG